MQLIIIFIKLSPFDKLRNDVKLFTLYVRQKKPFDFLHFTGKDVNLIIICVINIKKTYIHEITLSEKYSS